MRTTPDGNEFVIDVLAADDGALVGRARVTTPRRSIPSFALLPDGKALIVHDYQGQTLYWFDLPDRPVAAGPKEGAAPAAPPPRPVGEPAAEEPK